MTSGRLVKTGSILQIYGCLMILVFTITELLDSLLSLFCFTLFSSFYSLPLLFSLLI